MSRLLFLLKRVFVFAVWIAVCVTCGVCVFADPKTVGAVTFAYLGGMSVRVAYYAFTEIDNANDTILMAYFAVNKVRVAL